MTLKEELEDVERIRNPHARGKRFEIFLAHLLAEDGLTVNENPGTATPHQTDLSATRDHLYFLVEAKWHHRPAHLAHISAVRERLRTTTADVFACVFSMSGFSNQAIQEVGRDRSREIILFDEQEIRGIAAGDLVFSELLKLKREAFRTYAGAWFEVWIPEDRSKTHLRSKPDVIRVKGNSQPWMLGQTGNNDVLFSNEYLDVFDRVNTSVISLDLRLHIETVDDLQRILHQAKRYLGLEFDGSYAIHQRNAGWFGFGVANFLQAIKSQSSRYADLGWDSYHHSEEIGYVDRTQGGALVCISTRQDTRGEGYLHSSRMELILPGLPVNISGIQKFCEFVRQPDASFEIIRKSPVKVLGFERGIKLEPVAMIVSTSGDLEFASGLVVKNPFLNQPIPKPSKEVRDDLFYQLANQELLFCALRQWHTPNDLMDYYELQFAEACWIEHIPAFYIACDWKLTSKSEEIIAKWRDEHRD
jgi:hypothetical protein